MKINFTPDGDGADVRALPSFDIVAFRSRYEYKQRRGAHSDADYMGSRAHFEEVYQITIPESVLDSSFTYLIVYKLDR